MKITNKKSKKSFTVKNVLIAKLTITLLLLFSNFAQASEIKQVQTIHILMPAKVGLVSKRASELLIREVTERSNVSISNSNPELTIELLVKQGIGKEGFKIADGKNGSIQIIGNDENGLLYGVGKFLHGSVYSPVGFIPGTWRGESVPKCPVRGMHLDTHFMNYYEASNDHERKRYIEDLALWGTNILVVLFPTPWLNGFDDPKAVEALRRMNQMMVDAKAVGMQVGIAFGNDMGFANTPKELFATPGSRCWGPVILCPSKPSAMELMSKNLDRFLGELSVPGVDYVLYWPYDEGGCSCEKCAPWGSNGYAKMCQKFTSVVRGKYSKAKFILSTWFFDNEKDGVYEEYEGLTKFLAKDKSWVDYLMVDGHGNFPAYPLKFGVPGNLPMVNFPEISMYGTDPIWGGFGANPLPQRFQRLWNQAKEKLAGGIPYSEGIWEDLNKIICCQLYWSPDRQASDIMNEYISYEYSPKLISSVSRVIEILEQNLSRKIVQSKVIPEPGEWH
jgi:hypothetical protein